MSLNRYEQTVFDYLGSHPDELRHWRMKVAEAAAQPREAGELSRSLERELWLYFEERAQHTPVFRQLTAGGVRRVSLLNLAEHLLRLWGPPPKAKRGGPGEPARGD
ncbi:MAG: hypothetical protein HY302_04385 [Opitutae bacterium]|nr:hypothetical protein [Opitutae bacterium]